MEDIARRWRGLQSEGGLRAAGLCAAGGHWYSGGEQVRQPWPLEQLTAERKTLFLCDCRHVTEAQLGTAA